MKTMLTEAGFVDVRVEVKENASDIIKDWMPGSNAEKYVTGVYVTARKPTRYHGIRDDVRADNSNADFQAASSVLSAVPAKCGPGA